VRDDIVKLATKRCARDFDHQVSRLRSATVDSTRVKFRPLRPLEYFLIVQTVPVDRQEKISMLKIITNAEAPLSPSAFAALTFAQADARPRDKAEYGDDDLRSLRTALLNHPIYTRVASVTDLRRFMEDHVFAVWDFMSLLKRLQRDMTCVSVPWFPADNAKAARLINDIVIGEETDIGPDGSYVSHLDLYRRAMADIGAATPQFDRFCSLARAGVPVESALEQAGAPPHVQAFVAHTMALAHSGSTEEVLAAFFYGREDIIPEMFRRLLDTLYRAKHDKDRVRNFIYYIDRHIELDGDSHGPMGRELLNDLVTNSPQKRARALRAACASIKARIGLWTGTLNKLRDGHGGEHAGDRHEPEEA
jgi:hypothetical protein